MTIPAFVKINKDIGETPLMALERYRASHPELKNVPMTYAGRLDPMASGSLIILMGDECKNKNKYIDLDKEYEVEIVFGISTDTYDALGIVQGAKSIQASQAGISEKCVEVVMGIVKSFCAKCPYTFDQEYPPYSSKTVEGIHLHSLARKGSLPEVMPTKNVTIYSCEILKQGNVSTQNILQRICANIGKVQGDFRQVEILNTWYSVPKDQIFPIIKLRVKCSSGTYMRSLAHSLGVQSGIGAFALSIKRTRIFF